DPNPTDHAVEFLLVIFRISHAPFRQRHGETGRTQNVFAVLGDERRPMVAYRVWDWPEDLVRFEIAQIDARDTIVCIVVYEKPTPVVLRIGLRQRRVMHIAPGEIAEHLLRFLIESIARAGIRREDGNRRDMSQ